MEVRGAGREGGRFFVLKIPEGGGVLREGGQGAGRVSAANWRIGGGGGNNFLGAETSKKSSGGSASAFWKLPEKTVPMVPVRFLGHPAFLSSLLLVECWVSLFCSWPERKQNYLLLANGTVIVRGCVCVLC